MNRCEATYGYDTLVVSLEDDGSLGANQTGDDGRERTRAGPGGGSSGEADQAGSSGKDERFDGDHFGKGVVENVWRECGEGGRRVRG